ncbi:2-hydroxyglutaryl-CoA dehydratase [Spirochaetia bacterium]|nr:2-hydroxyglutaryl-CoA dehydratase [Spirochaetia bacterium]
MSRYAMGIDCGSAFCKGALLDERGIAALAMAPTGWDLPASGRDVARRLFEAAGLPAEAAVPCITTGYGREQIEGRQGTVTEITAHARGAAFLCSGMGTVIDIGGQDCKVIAAPQGRVEDFQMNDKCAAGSGSFLETVCRRLSVDAALRETLLAAHQAVPLTNTCVVFAESEIIGLLARGVTREAILGGVAAAMAARIGALAARLSLKAEAVLTGGFAESAGIAEAVSRALGMELRPLQNGVYAGAIGAACKAWEKNILPTCLRATT